MDIEYKDYLNDNLVIIKYICDNDLVDLINEAVIDAKKLSDIEGKQVRHSYYFSKIYDILDDKNLDKLKTSSIVNLIENKFEKNLDDLVNDYKSLSTEVIL